MFDKLKRLAGQSFIYTSAELLRSSLAFLLLPIYTTILTPADYGILGVVGPLYAFLSFFLGLGIQNSLTRFYFDYSDRKKLQEYIGTVAIFLLGSSLGLSVLLTVGGPRLFGLVLPQTPFFPFVLLTVWNACISVTRVLPLILFRVEEQPARYAALNLIDFLVTTGLIIYFVVGLRRGALGNLEAQVIAAVIIAVPSLWITARRSRLHFSWGQVGASLAFSLPLLPHLLGNWILNLSDRVVLDQFVSKADLGLYTLGYQFGLLLNILAVALNNAWVPFFYKHAGDREHDELVSLFTTYQVLVVAGLALALALLSREAIEIVAAPSYLMAYQVAPWIIFGYLARFLYLFPVNGLFYAKRTHWVSLGTLLTGALNIGLNLWLVPRYGILAAAVNTFIAFAVLLIVIYSIGQRIFPIRYQYRRIGQILVLAAGLYATGAWLAPDSLWPRVAVKTAILAAFPLLLWVTGFLSPAERKRLTGLWQKVL
ncbi:MAG: oligosaccharide flippase family protein [Anaerolineae bacterium]|jgi:O-antigen/teichoic acid export membrane protein|nr:oligosaccharide flippase family protein [Anaerolineae bacterium]MDX9832251.1 oligosaccharide flippase family protein [Anaerolineae bacterium]